MEGSSMSQTVKLQRGYTTRRNDPDNSLWVQEEAERLALIDGDLEEAHRRRIAAQSLKSKSRRRAEVKPIAFGIIRELGSRDAIGNMLKTRFLEERHGRTCLQIRDYMVARQVTMAGGGDLVFVEGNQGGGIENKIHALRQASAAVAAGEATLPSAEFVRPVTGLLCGHMTLLQAGRIIGGDTTKCKDRVKRALRNYLEAAEPYFGGR
jgi:hypothetical protein